MAISNYLFSPNLRQGLYRACRDAQAIASENPLGFSTWCSLAKLSAIPIAVGTRNYS